jgi:hypothetical protein
VVGCLSTGTKAWHLSDKIRYNTITILRYLMHMHENLPMLCVIVNPKITV